MAEMVGRLTIGWRCASFARRLAGELHAFQHQRFRRNGFNHAVAVDNRHRVKAAGLLAQSVHFLLQQFGIIEIFTQLIGAVVQLRLRQLENTSVVAASLVA